MSAINLRPMDIGDILDVTFRLYRRHFVTYLLIALTAYVPFALITATMQTATGQGSWSTDVPPDQVLANNMGALAASYIGMLVFFLIVWPLCQAAMVHNISAHYLGESLGAWESYKRGAHRVPRLLGAQFLAGIVVAIGFLLLVVPGVIFSLWFILIAPVVMLEEKGVSETLSRSRELMRGNLGKGFLLMLTIGMLGGLINFTFIMVLKMVPWPHAFVGLFFETLVQAVVVPIQLAPVILLYYDLRIRKEAFDLEKLAGDLGGPAPVVPV